MRFSTIIPTYNRGFTIKRAIDSILSQSIKDWELIVVDDGSTDNTEKIVKNFYDKRIKYFKFPKNKGVNYARNKGIEIASGDWIDFLDSDDEYLPNAFEIIIGILGRLKSNIDIVGFMNKEIVDNLIKKQEYITENINWEKYYPTYEDMVLKKGIHGDIHRCVRKKIFEEGFKFPEKINGLESLFFSNILKKGKKIIYINKSVALVHKDSNDRLSISPYLRWPKQFIWGYKKFVKEHYAILKKFPDRLAHYYLRIAKCYLKIKKPIGVWWLFKAFLASPNKFLRVLKNKIKN